MPRGWPANHVYSTKKICPKCGGKKDYYAISCRKCSPKPIGLHGKTRENHPTWKGGSQVDRDGYVRTYHPEHPWPRKGGYIRENVRVMELHVGRRMLANEVVHHKDENRKNNELDNLEIMIRGTHSRLHRLKDSHKRSRNNLGQFA